MQKSIKQVREPLLKAVELAKAELINQYLLQDLYKRALANKIEISLTEKIERKIKKNRNMSRHIAMFE